MNVKKIAINLILFLKRKSIFLPNFLIKICFKNDFIKIIDTRTNIEINKKRIKNSININQFKINDYKFNKDIYIIIGSGERNMIPEVRHIKKKKIKIFLIKKGVDNPNLELKIN